MIKFWRPNEDYGCFSNFSAHSIEVDGKTYKTTEHYYQSQKTNDPHLQDQIRVASTPKKSKQIAQEVDLREDWEDVKFEVMLDALRHKIERYEFIKIKLLETGDEELAEDSPYDYVWGLGRDGTGTNLLGKAWMQIREELRNRDGHSA